MNTPTQAALLRPHLQIKINGNIYSSSGLIRLLAIVSLLVKDLKQIIDFYVVVFFSINFHLILAFKFCTAFILQKVKQLNTVSPQVSGYSVNALIPAGSQETHKQ